MTFQGEEERRDQGDMVVVDMTEFADSLKAEDEEEGKRQKWLHFGA